MALLRRENLLVPGVPSKRRHAPAISTRVIHLRNKRARSSLADMPMYFFHLAGELPAHDLIGHDCADEKEAKDHASFIAHRIGTEKPGMVREGNFISVTDQQGREVHRVPLASTTA
jgi:hypothetical protein